MKGVRKLTVDEIESDDGTIRESPIVNWLTLSQNGVSQRCKVPNDGARPNVLQVWSSRSILATCSEDLKLLFGKIGLRIQFFRVSFVKLPSDSFIDIGDHGVVPKPCVLLRGIETSNWPRARVTKRSINCKQPTMWTHNEYPTPRGSQEITSKVPWKVRLSSWVDSATVCSPDPPGPPG